MDFFQNTFMLDRNDVYVYFLFFIKKIILTYFQYDNILWKFVFL